MKAEQARVKDLIADTVLLLCKNGLSYNDELRIEGVIGVTLDNKDLFLVHVNERLQTDVSETMTGANQQDEVVSTIPVFTQNIGANNNPNVHSPSFTDKSDFFYQQVGDSGNTDTSLPMPIKVENDDRGKDIAAPPSGPPPIFPTLSRRLPQKQPFQPSPHRPSLPGACQSSQSDNATDMYEPEAKRFAQDTNSSRIELAGSTIEQQSWTQLDEYASQAMVAAAAAMDIPSESRVQAPPGCSSWGSKSSSSNNTRTALTEALSSAGTTAPTEAKYPSHALQSHNIKEALAFGVVDPLLEANPGAKIMTFRLSWFGSDSSHLEKVWQNIVTLQEQMDQFVTAAAGAKIIVSAYTGTLSGRTTKTDTPGVRMSYPGLAYWVLSDREQLDERLFMRQLHEHAFGARIKSLLYEYEQNKDKITNALFVVLKDCTGGFVRRKVDESVNICADRGRTREQPALVRLWVKDATFWDTMLAAQGRLKSACCDVSLHQL